MSAVCASVAFRTSFEKKNKIKKSHIKFFFFFTSDDICGQSLVGSHARIPPVLQALSPCPISSQYLVPLESSGSDTIKNWKEKPRISFSLHPIKPLSFP
jgi:hypothetical protein